jgi:hypothetical protein
VNFLKGLPTKLKSRRNPRISTARRATGSTFPGICARRSLTRCFFRQATEPQRAPSQSWGQFQPSAGPSTLSLDSTLLQRQLSLHPRSRPRPTTLTPFVVGHRVAPPCPSYLPPPDAAYCTRAPGATLQSLSSGNSASRERPNEQGSELTMSIFAPSAQ